MARWRGNAAGRFGFWTKRRPDRRPTEARPKADRSPTEPRRTRVLGDGVERQPKTAACELAEDSADRLVRKRSARAEPTRVRPRPQVTSSVDRRSATRQPDPPAPGLHASCARSGGSLGEPWPSQEVPRSRARPSGRFLGRFLHALDRGRAHDVGRCMPLGSVAPRMAIGSGVAWGCRGCLVRVRSPRSEVARLTWNDPTDAAAVANDLRYVTHLA